MKPNKKPNPKQSASFSVFVAVGLLVVGGYASGGGAPFPAPLALGTPQSSEDAPVSASPAVAAKLQKCAR